MIWLNFQLGSLFKQQKLFQFNIHKVVIFINIPLCLGGYHEKPYPLRRVQYKTRFNGFYTIGWAISLFIQFEIHLNSMIDILLHT